MITRPSILFVCRDNAGLSLMAEALTMHLYARVRAFSAATAMAGPVDPVALECLEREGIATDGLSAKPAELFALSGAPRVDLAVALVEDAHRAARRLPWMHLLRLRGWGFEDITRVPDLKERARGYRRLLPELRAAITALVEQDFAPAAA
ncbi:arsenate-mycothiol transferase ArsC [Xanthobacter variabilis]|uniref:arsenate-mycothiol transferase ArsC n=1 Tax=Xanthobacter variabilis TaxID=3119932 RepID=UPI00374F9B55